MKNLSISVSNGQARLYTPYDKRYIERIKCVEGRKWDPTGKCWVVPEDNLGVAREIMREIWGYDDTDAPEEITQRYFTPVYPEYGDGVPFKNEVYIKDGRAYRCTYMHYDDDMEETTIRAIDITNSDEGRKALEKASIKAERKSILNELDNIKIDGVRSGGYEWKDEWSYKDAEILYKIWDYSEYVIYIKEGFLCIREEFYSDGTVYSFEKRPVTECEDIVTRIRSLVKRLEEIDTLQG